MAIVTMEDLQGTIEVVVFPRLYEQTMGTWRDGEILLVAGRVDHKSEDVSLLADLAVEWDAAVAGGREAFARQVAAGDRGGRRGSGGWSDGNGNGNGRTAATGPAARGAAARRGRDRALRPAAGRRRARRRRSSRRGGVAAAETSLPDAPTGLPRIAPAEPVSTYPATAGRPARCGRRRRAGRAGRGARPDRRGRHGRRPDRRRTGHGPPRPVRGQRPDGPRRRRDGDVQDRHARPAGRDPRRDPRACDRAAARWSCAAASPTTPRCWPRSGAGSATAWWTSASPEPEPRARSAARRRLGVGVSGGWPGRPRTARGSRRGSR